MGSIRYFAFKRTLFYVGSIRSEKLVRVSPHKRLCRNTIKQGDISSHNRESKPVSGQAAG